MLQKFLNLRKTDPTWFWLIVVLTLGLIFVVVIVMGVLFYIIGRKIHDRPYSEVRQIKYHTLIHSTPPPKKIEDVIQYAKFIELDIKYPKKTVEDNTKQAYKVITRFEKQESRWASLFERVDKNPIKVWNARLKLNNQQNDDYETQIKRIKKQQKDLKQWMKTASPKYKKTLKANIIRQNNAVRDVRRIMSWNMSAIDKLSSKIDSLRK